jgi:hypothetical protein
VIRVIVAGQLPRTEPNAMRHLFSGAVDAVSYGKEHYRQRSEESSRVLHQLILGYRGEGVPMPYTMKDFRRDYIVEHFPELSDEERLRLAAFRQPSG